MDPALALLPLDGTPLRCGGAAAYLSGAFLPIAVPIAALPPALRLRWALADPAGDAALIAATALDAGDEHTAFARLAPVPEPLRLPGVAAALGRWAGGERIRLGLEDDPVGIVVGPDRSAWRLALGGGLDAVRATLPLGFPRWAGPLVLVVGAPPSPALAETALRPALPILHVDATHRGRERDGACAAVAARLALATAAPPADGWPPWLTIGLAGACAAAARGEGPSPMDMHDRRRAAGAPAVAALLAERDAARVDAALATAVATWLVHPRRAAACAALLARLRAGDASAAALAASHQADAERLVRER